MRASCCARIRERTSLYGRRRPRDAAVVRVHGHQRPRDGEQGDQLAVGGPVTLHVRSNAPDGFTTTIWNGVTAVTPIGASRDFRLTVPAGPAVYWVEIRRRRPDARRAVDHEQRDLRSRDGSAGRAPPRRPPAAQSTALFDGHSTAAGRSSAIRRPWLRSNRRGAEHAPSGAAVAFRTEARCARVSSRHGRRHAAGRRRPTIA